MLLEIAQYGNPVLKEKCRPVEHFDDSLKTLAENMLETMYAAEGIGLAAPQVSIPIQLVVIDIPKEEESVRLLLPDHFRSDLAAPKVACPVSILAAGADEVIPPNHAKRLRDCFSVPVSYQEFPGAMHNTIWLSPGFDKAFSQSIGY